MIWWSFWIKSKAVRRLHYSRYMYMLWGILLKKLWVNIVLSYVFFMFSLFFILLCGHCSSLIPQLLALKAHNHVKWYMASVYMLLSCLKLMFAFWNITFSFVFFIICPFIIIYYIINNQHQIKRVMLYNSCKRSTLMQKGLLGKIASKQLCLCIGVF